PRIALSWLEFPATSRPADCIQGAQTRLRLSSGRRRRELCCHRIEGDRTNPADPSCATAYLFALERKDGGLAHQLQCRSAEERNCKKGFMICLLRASVPPWCN